MTIPLYKQRKIRLSDSNYFSLPGLKGIDIFPAYSKYKEEGIIKVVCKYYDISRERLFEKSRVRPLVAARQICIYLLKKYTKLTLKDIGDIGGYDHTTVIHSIRQISNLLQTDDKTKEDIRNIEYLLQ